MLAQLVGQEQVAKEINTKNLVSAIVSNSGVASKGFLFTATQVAGNEANEKTSMAVDTAVQGASQSAGQAVGQTVAQ